jgi:DNA gyrase subunit B
MATTSHYEALDIHVLPGTEGVRKRPGMYVGDVDNGDGLHHLLWEVVGNAIDEHLATNLDGYVRITLDDDRAIVEDNGRGMRADPANDHVSSIEHIMTTLHHGSAKRPHTHLGPSLHGTGLAPVCALSSELVVEVWRDGRALVQRFARGAAVTLLEELGPTHRTGTRISFVPDFTIFTARRWNRALIARRGRQLAALVPRVTVIVDDEAYRYPDGPVDHVRWVAPDNVGAPFHVRAVHDGIAVDGALTWARRGAGTVEAFVNCSPCARGMHVEGLFAALEAVFGRRVGAARSSSFRSRIRRGLVAFVNATLEDPRFRGPTREWLDNPEVASAVRGVVEPALTAHLARDPALLDAVLIRIGA